MLAYVVIIAMSGLPIYSAVHLGNLFPILILTGFRVHLRPRPCFCLHWRRFYILLLGVVFVASFVIIALYPESVASVLALAALLLELDQAAAAMVGLATLLIAVFEAGRDILSVERFIHKCKTRVGLDRQEVEEEIPLSQGSEEGVLSRTEQDSNV